MGVVPASNVHQNTPVRVLIIWGVCRETPPAAEPEAARRIAFRIEVPRVTRMITPAAQPQTPPMEGEPSSSAPFGVIFDSDGVIVDTETISLVTFRQATREFLGRELSDDEVESACGLRDSDIVARLRRNYDVAIDLEAYRARKAELYRQEAEKEPIRTFPGVVELLEHLRHERIPYALASSGPRRKIDYNLRSADMRSHFTVVVSGEEVERGKPEPDLFFEAARRMGVEPARCVVVEDSINGIRAAKAAGMAVLAVTNTFGSYQLHQADRVVESLERIRVPDLYQLVLRKQRALSGEGGEGGGREQRPEAEPKQKTRVGMDLQSLS